MLPNGYVIWIALGWVITLAVIAGMLWMVLRTFRAPSRANGPPEHILKRRLATGEIDVDEYAKRLAALLETKRAA